MRLLHSEHGTALLGIVEAPAARLASVVRGKDIEALHATGEVCESRKLPR